MRFRSTRCVNRAFSLLLFALHFTLDLLCSDLLKSFIVRQNCCHDIS